MRRVHTEALRHGGFIFHVNFPGFLLIAIFLFCFSSCLRSNEPAPAEESNLVAWSGAYPMAILQTGEQPLWFQLTDDGPVLIDTIEDAAFTNALIPWPYALHICFLREVAGGAEMAVNRDGFLKAAVNRTEQSLALYRFPGGDYWKLYTVGGFIYFGTSSVALLYLDNRFLDTDTALPVNRTWSYNMNSNIPYSVKIPVFSAFPAEEGWDIDTLRLADDGFYYYRAAKRGGASPIVRMFRAASLVETSDSKTEEISIEKFFNSAPRQKEFNHPSLPPLPEGFVYTGIARAGANLFASWEEQEDFSIGAAGFVVIKN